MVILQAVMCLVFLLFLMQLLIVPFNCSSNVANHFDMDMRVLQPFPDSYIIQLHGGWNFILFRILILIFAAISEAMLLKLTRIKLIYEYRAAVK